MFQSTSNIFKSSQNVVFAYNTHISQTSKPDSILICSHEEDTGIEWK